ncbi:Pex12 amino terminal region-domain-containing protein [Syncephalis pseudoplumigaleata]|uniref:RING-type E3 ubiquitin transferase (cysteine targeting) n=1 Tax=Syncephalis pseudoplumigaleata TaxID=1712513 RepID=A0A4V1J220_9FUNG|nr:Pex12 amino terminal region-domain-containing protein [Syncephalis pseudoplumigaleata]|eukprot:RKP27029.1 Pex12 amino terminal region-domain-containing protein [Syncephalis pseudoplumigaleata]
MTFWHAAATAAQADVEQLRGTLGATRHATPLEVQRVCQLDASLLDAELNSTLFDHAQQAVSLFKGKDRYKNEIMAGLEAIIYGFALFASTSSATYGARLQNLQYRNEYRHRSGSQHAPLTKLQGGLFCVVHVGGRYAWRRASHSIAQLGWADLPAHDWRRKCWHAMQRAERIGRLLSLANFIAFLFNGRYRTPLERLLGMRLVYAARQTSRAVSFEFLNRQLIWHAFTVISTLMDGYVYACMSHNYVCFV